MKEVAEGLATCEITGFPAASVNCQLKRVAGTVAPSAQVSPAGMVTAMGPAVVSTPLPSNAKVLVLVVRATGAPVWPRSAAGTVTVKLQVLAAVLVKLNVATWLVPRAS